VPERHYSDEEIDAALEALAEPERFRAAETRVARFAPQLQRILGHALNEGGWFGESHEAEVLRAATAPQQEDRIVAMRMLLAEETRIGMMVGVAVGWELARELDGAADRRTRGGPGG
jgi:hypothetical protein